jgi:hypothetical protein
MTMQIMLDEKSRPPLREVLGRLISAAAQADLAVAHVRLAAIDLTAGEASGMGRCRFLLDRLEAADLSHIGRGADRTHLHRLLELLNAGHVEIRSAGLGAWTPDFSVFRGLPGDGPESSDVCLVGAHYFHQPPVAAGPSLTCVLSEPHTVALAERRFSRLWQQAHDVQPAVVHTIERLLHDAS